MTVGPGAILGSYELLQLIARGGMGEVYRARHRRLTGREVAIKVMPAVLAADPTFLQRFEREANNIATLNHPNILPLWDYGDQDGLPYIVMPLVLGGSLRDRMHGRNMAPAEVLRYVQPIADALDYAHSRGIVHRDIKPANVLLDDRDQVYVADFGIAKATEGGAEHLTRTGVGIGTPEYMAPEQTQGQTDPRSDIYALGIIAYECLTGQVPYKGKTPIDVAIQHATVPVPPLDRLGTVVSPALDAAVRRALAKAPAERHATAGEFARAFAAACGVTPDGTSEERPTVAVQPPGQSAKAAAPTRAIDTPSGSTAQLAPAPTPPPLPPHTGGSTPARRIITIALVLGLVLGLGLAIGAVALLNTRGGGQQVAGLTTEPTAAASSVASATGVAGATGVATASALPYAFPIDNALLARKYEDARRRLPQSAQADAKLKTVNVVCFNPRGNADCELTYIFFSRAADSNYSYTFSVFDAAPVQDYSEQASDDGHRTVFIQLPWEKNPGWANLLRQSYTLLPLAVSNGTFRVELTSEATSMNQGDNDWSVSYLDRDTSEYYYFYQRNDRVVKVD